MSFFKNLPIGRRLGVALGSVTLVFLLIGALALFTLAKLAEAER